MSKEVDLFERMKTMNSVELHDYYRSASFIKNACSVLGVGSFLSMMIFTGTLPIIVACSVLYVCVKISVNADEAKTYLETLIAAKAGADK